MVYEPTCDPPSMATSQETAAERVQAHLERDAFLAQLANALTILNGWTYLMQISSCRPRQQHYLGAMQYTVQHITELMQHYK
ncbi:MAG: hypothetical protein ETSY1_22180 [Candidatus Entotheonella factor]|uniref:Uncharacterized protein n=1 Tax=Entotheonella factor TaxID=1429438 RepID=W4LIM1_ENTF1|nr:MAG: hypothetical protein ETSY1_22180 [Candidatus Entotheonella factor]